MFAHPCFLFHHSHHQKRILLFSDSNKLMIVLCFPICPFGCLLILALCSVEQCFTLWRYHWWWCSNFFNCSASLYLMLFFVFFISVREISCFGVFVTPTQLLPPFPQFLTQSHFLSPMLSVSHSSIYILKKKKN